MSPTIEKRSLLLDGTDTISRSRWLSCSGPVDSIPLQLATLCMDCNMITASTTDCLVCGSAALLNLARVMNRENHD